MNNDKLKFVVDSRSFDGSCVTTMSDGIHGDYHHETLEELRDREKNPYLIAVSGNTVRKMIRIHLQSLCAPFSEITEERYFDYMDVLPPIRHTRNFFFLGEPYHADIYRFCFRAGGRYFTGLRSVTTPRKELERQMDNHYRNITFKGDILKEKPMVISDHARLLLLVQNLTRKSISSLLIVSRHWTGYIIFTAMTVIIGIVLQVHG